MNEIQTPVLIAGGGGAGLTASMLLSTFDVDSPAALPSLLGFAKPGAALGADGHAATDRDNARALFTEES